MATIRWGILACGRIARKFAADLNYVEGAELVAVASRSIDRAKEFAAEFPAEHVLGSYEELVALPDVDGGLIGGASLKSRNFMNIINAI